MKVLFVFVDILFCKIVYHQEGKVFIAWALLIDVYRAIINFTCSCNIYLAIRQWMTCIFDPRSSHAFSPLDSIEYNSFLFIIAAKQVLTYEIEQEVLFRGTQRICCSLYLFPIGIFLAGKILGVPMIWLGNFLLLEALARNY